MSIKKPNMTPAEFRKLPKAEKAMLVAHDVIQQIKLKNIHAGCGSYLRGRDALYDLDDDASAKENICEIGQNCTVCAKGALFLGAIGRVNKATVGEVIFAEEWDMVSRLVKERIFSQNNLDLIECSFECYDVSGVGSEEAANEAVDFGCDHEDAQRRLVAIMLNVLDHNGKFVPKDRISGGRVNAALRTRVGTKRLA